jgi:serine/threonine protein kinase
MSLEIVKKEEYINKVDIWSYGILIYELLLENQLIE